VPGEAESPATPILAFQLLALKAGSTYEITWFYR